MIKFLSRTKKKISNRFISKKIRWEIEKDRIQSAIQAQKKPRSVLLYTTHKCASTFVPKVFRRVQNHSDYQLFDYASGLRDLGNNIDADGIEKGFIKEFSERSYDHLFFEHGEIYAPLRFDINFPGRESFKHIFFLRDPRDVLVSSFFSFGFTHALAPNDLRRETQLKRKADIQEKGIDQFVIEYAEEVLDRLNGYRKLRENCLSNLFLKYNDFTKDTATFIRKITDYIDVTLPDKVINEIVESARPIQSKVNPQSHKRSGKSGQFKEALKPETRNELNKIFKDVIEYWGF